MLTKLVEQLPSAVAIIVVVVYFIRYIQKRDEQENIRQEKTLTILTNISVSQERLVSNQSAHHTAMLDAVSDMRSVTRRRKNDARPD